MQPTNVLLAFGPRLVFESLAAELESHEGIVPRISEATQLAELLVEVQQTQAEAVIISAATKADATGIRSHLFSVFPHLAVIVLPAAHNGSLLYKQKVVVERLEDLSIETLVTAIHRGERYWSPFSTSTRGPSYLA